MLTEKGDLLAWLGHATFLIRLNGKTLLTDPVFYGASRLVKRQVALPVPPAELKGIDYLLLSHGHMDHCDEKSLRLLARNNPRMEVLTTLRLGALIGKWMPGLKIQEAGWYQQYALPTDSPRVVLLPAMHWYKRTPFDDNQRLWGSFVVQTPRTTLYFSGDSGYDSHFRQVGELFPVDIALMGVGAYAPPFMMQDSHMNPEEATRGFNEMGAKTFVPMHHGTFDLSDEPLGEPVRWLRRLESEGTLKGLKVLDVGEVFNL
ncbi:MAG: MBL fold metallo-hydrolase [Ferruginibacter sp.]|nr:MBL fold metallo-hydrolase [Cytophagales bacterium]